jgi:hypothetical protein
MMFDDWKTETNRYILRHLDRKPFRALEGELEEDIAQLGDAYTAVLSENGVIDRNGTRPIRISTRTTCWRRCWTAFCAPIPMRATRRC